MLRHSYATILFEAGIEAKDAQALMGHSDISTTLETYSHLYPKESERALKVLNEITI
jgi:site-specific recombinase XerD